MKNRYLISRLTVDLRSAKKGKGWVFVEVEDKKKPEDDPERFWVHEKQVSYPPKFRAVLKLVWEVAEILSGKLPDGWRII